ncbi:hypothetical protein GCM10029976_035600 [Kribbella albertanoniae]|uniref:DUF4265 domain-containing protein n=1 Tax=Kribbella albertanoniae TaxID=1266829 RepID=A0A4R4QBZ1_9ACTN|nr:DUF4265 domain-containing protein [Kribbella albertanoniae]TDC32914.1 DUF4265 domain-containing protein [Kribbella albertanoniae]
MNEEEVGTSVKLYKVAFDLPEDIAHWARASAERLWVEKTDRKLEVRVRNTPFYVKGVAFGDLVKVKPDGERRELVFDEFVSESGHSTVRVIIKDPDSIGLVNDLLRGLECSWEIDSSELLWAIDVPPQIDYRSLRLSLLDLNSKGKIGIEEGAIASEHRSMIELTDSE